MSSGEKQGCPGRHRKKSRRRTISQGEGKMETAGAGAGVVEEEAGKGKGKGKAEQEVNVSFVAIDTTQNSIIPCTLNNYSALSPYPLSDAEL